MDRRVFLSASAAGLASGSAAAANKPANQYFALRFYQLRNSNNQRARLAGFLEQHHLPMTKRHGIGPVGYFQVDLGVGMPRIVTVTAYHSWNALEETAVKKQADVAWTKALDMFGASDQPPYVRSEAWLLRAFDGTPKLEAPSVEPDSEVRLFDLRTYQSETLRNSLEKIRMFNTEEIAIFRRCGIHPVFFGQTLFGSRLPNLTYMVWYDDRNAREAAWEKFRQDPDWQRIRVKPGWTDAEIVSNISNTFLRPLPFSPIR